MPETVGTFLAFLLFVTPGLIFELLRERSRPEPMRSTFRETSVVVVASVAFSAAALTMLLLVRAIQPAWLPNPAEVVRSPGQYATTHLAMVTKALTIQVLLATLFAVACHIILCRIHPGGDISPNPAWFEIIRGNANPRRDAVLLMLELRDGSAVRGLLKGYDFKEDHSLRTLVLRGSAKHPLKTRHATTGSESLVGRDWAYIVVPSEEIKRATVAFVDP